MDFSILKEENSNGEKFLLTIGHVGDSRVLVFKPNGELLFMTDDHKPARMDEQERIVKAGGFVENQRVNGMLAVSRAIGDWNYKQTKHLPATEQWVIAVPEISHLTVEKGTLVFLACDGLFEGLSAQNIVDFIVARKDQMSPQQLLPELLEHSLACKSTDNMSSIVVFLGEPAGPGDVSDKPIILPGPFYPACLKNQNFTDLYVKDLLSYTQLTKEIVDEIGRVSIAELEKVTHFFYIFLYQQ